MNINESFLFIMQKTGDKPVWNGYYYILLFVDFVLLAIVTFYLVKFLNAWRKQTKEQRYFLRGLLIIGFSTMLRFLVFIGIYLIRLITNNEYTLRYYRSLQTLIWIGFIYGAMIILKTNIKIPKRRKKRLNLLQNMHVFAILLLFGLIIITNVKDISNEQSGKYAILFILAVLITLWLLVVFIYREANNISSKLTQARLHMISLGILTIAISFTLTPIIILLAILHQYTAFVDLLYSLTVLILSVLSIYSFNNAIFVPKWLKERYGLILPKEGLLD